jgi:integrase/recombinase XerD
MIDAMQVRGLSVRTHRSYLSAVADLARYYRRSPDQVSGEELQAFFGYLAKERGLSGASCRLYLNAIRFFYLHVLRGDSFRVTRVVPKRAQRIPGLLTRAEVGRMVSACANFNHRIWLTTCYGCGLRVSEAVALKVRHLDGERRLLRVEQGQGAKDLILSETLLHLLRGYWRVVRPPEWRFPGYSFSTPLTITGVQKAFTAAKRRAGIDQVGGIHARRHAYATPQLEAGMPVPQRQRLLGHPDIHSTWRYGHWVPHYREGKACTDLVAGLEGGHD